MKDRPSPAILRQLLRYDPDSGKLFWLTRDRSFFQADKDWKRWNSAYSNKEAFTARGSQGARHGKIFGVVYYAHIVAWAIHFGEWPAVDIDHESGNRSDNRLVNIREAGKSLNMQNKKIYKTNKTGVHGVRWDKDRRKWQSYITVDKKRIALGFFDEIEDAKLARITAQESAGFHANHGRLN